MIDLLLLVLGFVFTFFIPGFLIIETFFAELSLLQKLPLYSLISVLISTYTVYLVSLILGFSRFSILLSFLIFGVWLMILFAKKKFRIELSLNFVKTHTTALLLTLLIFTLFLAALYPGIFFHYKDYFVMSSVNWQDTAMHQSIIETISQGNFPPQAPYFSGQPLNYYYFIDFHSAILETLYSEFFPRILVYDNPLFAAIFFLSVYMLAYDYFKGRLSAILAALLATLNGNFLYYKFFPDVSKYLDQQANILTAIRDILASHSYTIEYGKLMQMAPMADYFLQNRPMMLGLPVIVMLIFLFKKGFEQGKGKYFILSGLVTAMLIKFQLFAFGIGILTFLLSWFTSAGQNFRKKLNEFSYYFIPLIIFIFFASLLFSNSYAISAFLANFRFGIWDQTKGFYWYLLFPFANVGIPFVASILFILLIFFKKIHLSKDIIFLITLSLCLGFIPYTVYFTIYDGDMLKFFHFLLIPLSVIAGLVLQKIWRASRFAWVIVILLIFASSFSSLLTLGGSFFNKNLGYSEADYQAGIWIREHTAKTSVFLTMPTVHSAVSDIGGRIRVLSYTTWPYSHGFNRGDDNVFTRQANIESVYQTPSNTENVKKVLSMYNVSYIYLGTEEKNKYPFVKQVLDQEVYLKPVYDFSGITVYKII